MSPEQFRGAVLCFLRRLCLQLVMEYRPAHVILFKCLAIVTLFGICSHQEAMRGFAQRVELYKCSRRFDARWSRLKLR